MYFVIIIILYNALLPCEISHIFIETYRYTLLYCAHTKSRYTLIYSLNTQPILYVYTCIFTSGIIFPFQSIHNQVSGCHLFLVMYR